MIWLSRRVKSMCVRLVMGSLRPLGRANFFALREYIRLCAECQLAGHSPPGAGLNPGRTADCPLTPGAAYPILHYAYV